MTRRSLATRRADGSSGLRPDVPGYIDFNANVGECLTTTRTPLASCTTLEFAIRVKLDALAVNNRFCGWGTAGAAMSVSTGNLLNINVKGSSGSIGAANATVQIPAAATTQPVWLRGKITVATALCEYWYSLNSTENYEQVAWTSLGSATGSNPGTTVTIAESATMTVGNFSQPVTASMAGNVYGFYEIVNGVRTAWFTNSDIPDPPANTFISAGGGQQWSMTGGMTPNQFVPSQSYQGGLRNDFAFDLTTTGVGVLDVIGVVDVSYTTVRVTYQPALVPNHPTLGAFDEAMIVRSTAGFPATNLDGVMIMRHLSVDPVLNRGFASVLDKELSPQQWYYYSLFARYDDTSGWFKVGEQAWLNPGEYGNAERFWQGFPDYYRRIDSGGWLYPGVLRRLCDVFGYEFDTHRTWTETVGDVWDFEKLSAKLLPEAGAALGLPKESANGDRRMRTLVGNLIALRKKKGTKDGTEGYVGALTGYPTRVYEGLSLMHRLQHAEWPNSFPAQDGSGSATADNHPGWASNFVATNFGQLSRQVAAGGEGTTGGTPIGMADGSFYLRITNNTGAVSPMNLMYGHTNNSNGTFIPVVGNHTYKFSGCLKASTAGNVVQFLARWFDGASLTPVGSNTIAYATIGTSWVRTVTTTLTAPAAARFCQIGFTVPAQMAINAHLNLWHPMFVDLSWRPEGIPSLKNTVPLSSALSGDIGTFVHQDYYEPPREVKVNIYPMRTNLALNSDFSLDNLPPGAWSTFDAPTYGQLPIAYSDYADIIDAQPGDSETSYADMAAGLAPLIGTPPTLLWDTAGGRLHINKTTAPYAWTLMHTYFPATDLGGMSAALGAYSSVAGTKLTLAFEWYTAIGTSIQVDGVPVRNTSPEYTLGTTESRYELVNVQPPATALYGRLLVMVSNTVAHDTSLSWALIEDSPYPENYFNGTNNDGEDGDFFFATGKGYVGDAAPHQSPSVYYQRFRRFASGVGGADALTQLMPELLPFRRSFKVVTAATGLYNVPV